MGPDFEKNRARGPRVQAPGADGRSERGLVASCDNVPGQPIEGAVISVNLVRNLAAPAACTLALLLSTTTACGPKPPPGTNPPGESGGASGGGDGGGDGGGSGSSDGGASDGGGDDGGGGDSGPKPEKCDAKTADSPTLLFGMSMLIRAPFGVTFQDDDGNPTFTQAVSSAGFVSTCDATVKRVLVFVFQNDKKKGLDKTVDEFIETLEQQGYQNGSKGEPVVNTKTDFHIPVEYSASGGNQASKLYIAAARRAGDSPAGKVDNTFIMVYEASPEEFKLLEPTFKASAETLLVIPAD
jgi:hypothetical protein